MQFYTALFKTKFHVHATLAKKQFFRTFFLFYKFYFVILIFLFLSLFLSVYFFIFTLYRLFFSFSFYFYILTYWLASLIFFLFIRSNFSQALDSYFAVEWISLSGDKGRIKNSTYRAEWYRESLKENWLRPRNGTETIRIPCSSEL